MSDYTSERLARALGWTYSKVLNSWEDKYGMNVYYGRKLPRWEHDLNAIHEVEMGLTDEQYLAYEDKLEDWYMDESVDWYGAKGLLSAPADVRLRALIETLESE